MANKHMKKCSIALIIRKMQIKTTIKFCFKSVRMAKKQNYCIKRQANLFQLWWMPPNCYSNLLFQPLRSDIFFLILPNLIGGKLYFIAVLICKATIMTEAEYLYTALLAIFWSVHYLLISISTSFFSKLTYKNFFC